MSLRELLSGDRPHIFLDGAMGTQLGQAGLEMGGQNNVTNPDAVLAVHKRYAACGIDLHHHQYADHEPRESRVAQRGGRGARGESGRRASGQGGGWGGPTRAGRHELHRQTAQAIRTASRGRCVSRPSPSRPIILAEGGVDGFIIETMFDLREALLRSAGGEAGERPARHHLDRVQHGQQRWSHRDGQHHARLRAGLDRRRRRRGRYQLRQPRSFRGRRACRHHERARRHCPSSPSRTPAWAGWSTRSWSSTCHRPISPLGVKACADAGARLSRRLLWHVA